MKISRRNFFGKAACAAMGTTTIMDTLMNLSLTNGLIAGSAPPIIGGDYKALVCILLAGGNDSYNMLVPNETDSYNTYAATRSNMALAQNTLLPITATNGTAYGLHPSMPEVQNLYNNGKLAFLANTGTLIEPVANAAEYQSGSKSIPLGLHSHSDQQQQWQTSILTDRSTIGWGGRMADILQSLNTQQQVSMNISLNGRNVWQAGNSVTEYAIDNVNGTSLYHQYDNESNAGFLNELRNGLANDLMAAPYGNVLQQTLGNLGKGSLDSYTVFSEALPIGQPINSPFSSTDLSQDLKMVARTIAARNALDVSRQTFFVSMGGFDLHNALLEDHALLLREVSQAMGEFYAALEELNVADCVTTFTVSDFARSLTSNGDGTDHSWGGNQMVMGGAVNGGQIFGSYPDLTTSNDLAVNGRGSLIPTTSADEYFAELAMWLGVSRTNGDLYSVLPNIGNFYSPSMTNPIGFLPV